MKMNKKDHNIFDAQAEAERQIVLKTLKIKDSLSEAERLTKLMMNCWETEESEMFFFAYSEFKSEIEQLLESCKKDITCYEKIKNEINIENNDILEDDIIS